MARSFTPGERTKLELAAAERELLLNDVLFLDDDDTIAQAIRDTPPTRPALLTLDEMEQLAENLAAAANHVENQTSRAEMNCLYDKVDALIDSFGDEE